MAHSRNHQESRKTRDDRNDILVRRNLFSQVLRREEREIDLEVAGFRFNAVPPLRTTKCVIRNGHCLVTVKARTAHARGIS